MNLRQLEVFLAVVEHGGFSAAARATRSTQSTISQHIAALEAEVGAPLLERSQHGVRVTDEGQVLRKHAKTLVAELHAAEASIRGFRGVEPRTLSIGVSTIPAAYLVPPVLSQLCERFPHLDVRVLHGDSRATVDRIVNREAEVGVVGRRFKERGLVFTEVGADRIVLVVPPGHAWTEKSSISPAELQDGTFVFREPGSGTGATVVEALRNAGVEASRLRIRAEMGGNEAIKAAVRAGIGASFLSWVAVASDVIRGELAIVRVDGLSISRSFHLVQRSGRRASVAADAFGDLLLKSTSRTMPD